MDDDYFDGLSGTSAHLDGQRDTVPNSYQAVTTTSDNAPMEREHLQAYIKQETDAEVFGAELGLSDVRESLRTSSVSSEDLCKPNNLPVGDGAHKTSIDPPSELRKLLLRDVKQEKNCTEH